MLLSLVQLGGNNMEYIFQCYDEFTKQNYRKKLVINMDDRLVDISNKNFDNKPLGLVCKKTNSIILSLDYVMNDDMEFCWDIPITDARFKDIIQRYPNLSDEFMIIVNLNGIGSAGGPWRGIELWDKLNEFYKENPLAVEVISLIISYFGKKLFVKIKPKIIKYFSKLKCHSEKSYTNSIESRELWRLDDLKKAIHCDDIEVLMVIMYYLGYSYDSKAELFEKSKNEI